MREGAVTLANGYSGLSLFRAVQVHLDLARAIALFYTATLTVPFSTQVYTTPSPSCHSLGTREFNAGDSPVMD